MERRPVTIADALNMRQATIEAMADKLPPVRYELHPRLVESMRRVEALFEETYGRARG